MGDKCHMTIEIGGCIKSKRTLFRVAEALHEEHACIGTDAYVFSSVTVVDALNALTRHAIAAEVAMFSVDGVNHADLSSLETVLRAHDLDYVFFNEAGAEYPAGYKSYDATTKTEYAWDEGAEDIIEVDDVLRIVNSAEHIMVTRINMLRDKCGEIRSAAWTDIRKLSIADNVRPNHKTGEKSPGYRHLNNLLHQHL